jgi:flavin-dependent dehydrogenase
VLPVVFDDIPGYSWYVPKGAGVVNIGIGGVARAMRSAGGNIRDHWGRFARKLETLGLVTGTALQPRGCNYYVRRKRGPARLGNVFLVGDSAAMATRDMGEGIGAAVESGLRAAAAIAGGGAYETRAIPSWSVPGILTARLQRRRRP